MASLSFNSLAIRSCPWRIPERGQTQGFTDPARIAGMGDFRFVLAHLIVTLFRLAKPGGILA